MWVNSIAWTLAIIVCGRIDYKLDSYPTWLYVHLHTMGEKRDTFAGLGWEKEIRSLDNPHIPVNSSPEFEFRPGNAASDDYDLTHFRSLHKHGGGGCRRSKDNMREKKQCMKMCRSRTLMCMKTIRRKRSRRWRSKANLRKFAHYAKRWEPCRIIFRWRIELKTKQYLIGICFDRVHLPRTYPRSMQYRNRVNRHRNHCDTKYWSN